MAQKQARPGVARPRGRPSLGAKNAAVKTPSKAAKRRSGGATAQGKKPLVPKGEYLPSPIRYAQLRESCRGTADFISQIN
jgi:hypothetical protein